MRSPRSRSSIATIGVRGHSRGRKRAPSSRAPSSRAAALCAPRPASSRAVPTSYGSESSHGGYSELLRNASSLARLRGGDGGLHYFERIYVGAPTQRRGAVPG